MTGIVTAFDANTGKQLWQKPGSEPYRCYTSHSFSPLVDRGLVIFHVGGHNQGALTAYDVNTGAVKWSWNGDGPGHGSPILVDLAGTRQIVTITQGKIVGVDPANGTLLWERPFVSANFYECRHAGALRPDVDRVGQRRSNDGIHGGETEQRVDDADGVGERGHSISPEQQCPGS